MFGPCIKEFSSSYWARYRLYRTHLVINLLNGFIVFLLSDLLSNVLFIDIGLLCTLFNRIFSFFSDLMYLSISFIY